MKPERKDISLFQKSALATLATLIVILLVLLASEIHTKRKHREFIVLVDEQDFEEPEPFKREKKMKQLDESIEKMLQEEIPQDKRKNIAVNKANQQEKNEHTQTQIKEQQTEEEYRQELIKNAIGDQDYEKYIENKPEWEEQGDITVPENNTPQKVEKKVYTGPSNIIFYLDNREIKYIDVPVYLCQGSADITVKIVVAANGLVKRAQIDEQQSSSMNECYTEAALKAAQTAIFTGGGPESQTGKITFHFVAQN